MILVVTTNCLKEARYWQRVLPDARVVYEEWPGGAGNGLGTLYAAQQAGVLEDLRSGKPVALYHTAGKGTRLAPLPGSEFNNKSAVKIPGAPTLLEAVIEQTKPLLHPGRLSVFWGDQLFTPSIPLREPKRDVELFAKLKPPPTQKQWNEQNLHQYGLVLLDNHGNARQLEKTTYETLSQQTYAQMGISLGSFSLSVPFLKELLQEFSPELQKKQGHLNTDTDFWMPLSWGTSSRISGQNRIGAIDIGQEALWLDFGTLRNYWASCLKLQTENINCHIDEADIQKSLLINVTAKKVRARNSVLINVTAPTIDIEEGILYNTTDRNPISLQKSARADAHNMPFIAPIDGAPWETKLPNNPMSFADLYALNSVGVE